MRSAAVAITLALALVAGAVGYQLGQRPEAPALGPVQDNLYNEIGLFSTDADMRAYLVRRHDAARGEHPFDLTAPPDYAALEALDWETVMRRVGHRPEPLPLAYAYYRRLGGFLTQPPEDRFGTWLDFTLRTGDSAMLMAALEGEEALYVAVQKTRACVLAAILEETPEAMATRCLPPLRDALAQQTRTTISLP